MLSPHESDWRSRGQETSRASRNQEQLRTGESEREGEKDCRVSFSFYLSTIDDSGRKEVNFSSISIHWVSVSLVRVCVSVCVCKFAPFTSCNFAVRRQQQPRNSTRMERREERKGFQPHKDTVLSYRCRSLCSLLSNGYFSSLLSVFSLPLLLLLHLSFTASPSLFLSLSFQMSFMLDKFHYFFLSLSPFFYCAGCTQSQGRWKNKATEKWIQVCYCEIDKWNILPADKYCLTAAAAAAAAWINIRVLLVHTFFFLLFFCFLFTSLLWSLVTLINTHLHTLLSLSFSLTVLPCNRSEKDTFFSLTTTLRGEITCHTSVYVLTVLAGCVLMKHKYASLYRRSDRGNERKYLSNTASVINFFPSSLPMAVSFFNKCHLLLVKMRCPYHCVSVCACTCAFNFASLSLSLPLSYSTIDRHHLFYSR